MFGDFMQNFGLNGLPWDGIDAQGGLFGSNAPQTPLVGSQPAGIAPSRGGGGPAGPLPGAPAAPQGSPPVGGNLSPMSPSGASPLANPAQPGQGGGAPAAGVGSPFGAPQ